MSAVWCIQETGTHILKIKITISFAIFSAQKCYDDIIIIHLEHALFYLVASSTFYILCYLRHLRSGNLSESIQEIQLKSHCFFQAKKMATFTCLNGRYSCTYFFQDFLLHGGIWIILCSLRSPVLLLSLNLSIMYILFEGQLLLATI